MITEIPFPNKPYHLFQLILLREHKRESSVFGKIRLPIEHRCIGGTDIAILTGDEKQIIDVQSALDLAISLKHEAGIDRIAIDKHVVADEFFILSSGMAGEIIQKFVNYHVIAAIYGDFSWYTSKPLRDFIRESNRGSCFFFLSTQEEAIQRLLSCQTR